MEFKEFVDMIVEGIPEYLHQYDIDKIHIENISKNNGITYTGLIIVLKGENLSPNIYLDYYYTLYNKGYSLEHILEIVGEDYRLAKTRIDKDSFEMPSTSSIEELLFIKLINYERNKELLSDCPYIPFFDLAITFRFLVKKDGKGIASGMVRNEDMKRWGINTAKLYNMAKENMLKMFPPKLSRLDTMLRENLGECPVMPDEACLYVLTNEQGINGASYMIYKDIISRFSDELGCSLYIIPSSIHEILILPSVCAMTKEELIEMVKEINLYVVSDLDFLSDNVYFYDREDEKIIN